MNESTLNQVALQLIKHRRYKRWQILVSVLASIVVFVTTYLLILPAITKETELYCGFEEHIHTDECYSCYADFSETGLPENHTHDDCELVCESEKHEHTEMCYINLHSVVIKMSYDSREVNGDIADNGISEASEAEDKELTEETVNDEETTEASEKKSDSESEARENEENEYIVVWERHISVKDGEALIKYVDGISKLPNGFEVKDATWYNAENDKEFSLTTAVVNDLELYADFNEVPEENAEDAPIMLLDSAEIREAGLSSWEHLVSAINSGAQEVTLANDIVAPEGAALEISGKNITINMNGCTLTLSKPLQVSSWSILTIKGQGTIQGSNLDELISVTSSTLNFSDTVLTNPGGHGIHLKDWSTMNMYSGSITNCGSPDINGGGILAENGSGVNIGGGTISNNTAQFGGGIYLSGNSAVNMTGGTISGNSATDGGGVCFSGGISTFSGGSITENTASGNGGGIYAGSWSKADVRGNANISANKAGAHGGGIYADNTVNADPRIAVSGQAVVRENVLTGAAHEASGCVLQDSLTSCKNIAAGTGDLLSITEDAYVEGIVSTDGLSGLIAEANGTLVLEANQKSENRIVIDADLTIDLNGYKIEYDGSGSGSTLFDVSPGVTLTIIDSSETKSGAITANGAEALITVEESAVLNIQNGTLTNSKGEHVILVNGNGTVNMSGGILTGASTGEWGGGICAMEGQVNLSGGKITGNTVSVGGGGICTRYLNMSGGEISYNTVSGENARGGGGINLKKESHDTSDSDDEISYNGMITGGTISNNTSDHVGGGIFVAVGSEIYIKGTTSPVYIEDNKALDKNYRYGDPTSTGHGFAGGGIFVEHPDDSKGGDAKNGGLLYIYDAVVTENTARFGGGVAGCGSSSVEVCSNDGVAVYGNKIIGVDDGGANQTIARSVDLYCDGIGKVDSMLLGDIQSGWSGLTDEGGQNEISFKEGAPTLNNFYLKGDELSAESKEKINNKATVFIRGNSSGSGGGGIGGNGYIKLGLTAPTGSLIIKKKIVDADAGDWSFEFLLTINGEEQTVILTKDNPSITIDELPLGTTYSIKEKESGDYILVASSDTEGTINGNIVTASFTNAILYTLPATGGSGTAILYIVGGALILAAAVVFITKRRTGAEKA